MSGRNGRDQRRFPRYDVAVTAILRKRNGDVPLRTANVSRHGAFIRSAQPVPLRQLVQLRFRLPEGDVDAMCMVARWLGPEHPNGPGFGVDFFALSKEAKNLWERFVAELRAGAAFSKTTPPVPAPAELLDAPPLVPGVPLPEPPPLSAPQNGVPLPPGVTAASTGRPEWLAPTELAPRALRDAEAIPVDLSDPAFEVEALPLRADAPLVEIVAPPTPEDKASVVIHRLPTSEALKKFVDNEVQRGGMFLHTALVKEVGDRIDVLLVHPDTEEEFRLEGTVVRRVVSGPAEQRGLGIFFRALTPEQEKQLAEFVDSGIEVVELGAVISERQIELEAAVAREPDNAEALEALGTYLLDEEGDLGGAISALTRALLIGPSVVSIHASLARAYRRVGDQVRVRAHERVAEALMLMQDRMKVRLGVGDDDVRVSKPPEPVS